MANQPAGNTAVNRIQNFITGSDQSKAAFESVGASLRKVAAGTTNLRGRLRDLTVIGSGAIALFKSLGQAVATSSKAIVDMELAEKRLEFTLKKTGQFSAETKRGFLDLAESLQFTTRFTAATTVEMEQLLLSMGRLTKDQLPETITLLQSYIDVYRGGQGAIEITRQFSRFTGGAGGDVGEMGIIALQGASSLEKWTSAMDQLRKKFGGATFFLANTASGRVSIFQNVIAQVTLNFGQAIIKSKSFQDAMEAVVSVIKEFGFASVGTEKVSKTLIKFFDAVIGFAFRAGIATANFLATILPLAIEVAVTVVELLANAIEALGNLIVQMFRKDNEFVAFLDRLGAAGQKTADSLLKLGKALQTTGSVLGEVFGAPNVAGGPGIETIGGTPQAIKSGREQFAEAGNMVVKVLAEISKKFEDLQKEGGFEKLFEDMSVAANESNKDLQGVRKTIIESTAAIQDYQAATTRFFVEAFDRSIGLQEAYSNLGDALKEAFITDAAELGTSALFSRTVEVRDPTGQLLRFEEQLGPLGAGIELLTSPFKALGDSIADSVMQTTLLGDKSTTVAARMKTLFDPIGKLLAKLFEIPIQLIGTLLDKTVGFLIDMLAQGLTTMFGLGVAQKAETVAMAATQIGAASAMGAVTSGIATSLAVAWTPAATLAAIATFGGALGFAAGVPGLVGANIAAVAGISAGTSIGVGAVAAVPAQRGALVTGPSFLLAGEAGDEAVLPLEGPQLDRVADALGTRGGETTLNINIRSLTVRRREDIRDIADAVARELGLELSDASGFGTTGGLGRG